MTEVVPPPAAPIDADPPAAPPAVANPVPELQAPTAPVMTEAPKFDLNEAIKKWAGEDKAKLNSLRYKSLEDMATALFNAKQKIREGGTRSPLKAEATPEELAEYRAANGIPEKHEDYLRDLPNGLVIGDEDKPIFDSVMQRLHKLNADPAVAKELASWYYEHVEEQEAKYVEVNETAKNQTEDALIAKWGHQYKANANILNNVVAQMPKALVGTDDEPGPLFMAHLEDGRQLLNVPEFVEWIVDVGRQIHAPTTPLSSGNNPGGQSDEARLAELQVMMGNYDGPYWKGPMADAYQKELVSINERILKKQAKV